LRQKFGHRVHKVSLDAGFTCPNVDGTVAVGGVFFCDNRSFSPSRRLPRTKILGQLDEGIRRIKWRFNVDHFLAYFQPATNTYAPVERLRPLYEQALEDPRNRRHGDWHAARLCAAAGARPADGVRGSDVPFGRVWRADDARPVVGTG